MNIKNLYWIIPLSIFIGMVSYSMLLQHSQMLSTDGWISCIEDLDFCETNKQQQHFLDLTRGCDIGCIDYDLRQNGYNWQTSEEEYNILESENYKKCSEFCEKNYN